MHIRPEKKSFNFWYLRLYWQIHCNLKLSLSSFLFKMYIFARVNMSRIVAFSLLVQKFKVWIDNSSNSSLNRVHNFWTIRTRVTKARSQVTRGRWEDLTKLTIGVLIVSKIHSEGTDVLRKRFVIYSYYVEGVNLCKPIRDA